MGDLSLSVLATIGGSTFELQNPPPANGVIVSPSVYTKVIGISFGDTVWVRTTVKNDFMHGAIQVAAVKDEPKLMLALRLYGASLSDIWLWSALVALPIFSQDDYNLQFTINGAITTFECSPADHKLGGSGSKGDLDPHQLRANQQELILTIPRSPVAVAGPSF